MSGRPSSPVVIWLMFIALSFVWGSSFLFIKIALEEGLQPVTLVTYRLLIASVFVGAVVLIGRGRLPRRRPVIARLALLAVINVVIPFTLITWGELWIPSALASILNGLVPLFTIVLAAVLLRDEPITLNRLAGLLIGFAGAVLLISPNLAEGGPDVDAALAIAGELALVAASLSYAFAAIFIRREIGGQPLIDDPAAGPRRATPAEIALPQNVLGALMTGSIALAVERPAAGLFQLPPTPLALFGVVWLGVLGSGVAYLLFFRIIDSWGATRTSMVTYVMPVVGIALGFLVLGERLHPLELLGSLLVISGLVLASSKLGQRRLARSPRPAAEAGPASE